MSNRRTGLLFALLIFLTFSFIVTLYFIDQTQTIGKQAQVIDDIACTNQGGLVVSSSIVPTCPLNYVNIGTIGSSIGGQDNSDLLGDSGGDGSQNQNQTSKICCVPKPTEVPTIIPPTDIPTPTFEISPTETPEPTIEVTPIPSISPTQTACIEQGRVPQLKVSIDYICPTCK